MISSQTFYLGTDEPAWLERLDVALFISRRRLARRVKLPIYGGGDGWALDSGGFTELSQFGVWVTSPRQYAAEVERYQDEIGGLRWAASQDSMCEPAILAKTRQTVQVHQRRTVDNYLELMYLAPSLPWVPVLQGWRIDDYLRCVDLYSAAGVDLAALPLVGVGTLCRRHKTAEALAILERLSRDGIRLHGFGFKSDGLARGAPYLASADSMAWSYAARRAPPMIGCQHRKCSHCIKWALAWRARLLSKVESHAAGARQMLLRL